MLTGRKQRKRGFTLVETVVTVGIVAALAAVVYPTVVKQFDSADPTRVAEDLNNIRTGIETFGVNVRPHMPRDLEDLSNKISTTDTAITSVGTTASYSLTDSLAWQGPYISLNIATTALRDSVVFTSGFGSRVHNRITLYDVDLNATGGDSVPIASLTSAEMAAIHLSLLSGVAFNAINEFIDGPSESTMQLRRHSGRWRCPGAVTTNTDPCANAYYLAVPLR